MSKKGTENWFLGWEHLGISPGGALKGMVGGSDTGLPHRLVRNIP